MVWFRTRILKEVKRLYFNRLIDIRLSVQKDSIILKVVQSKFGKTYLESLGMVVWAHYIHL
jgi:hypothetical protein